MPTDHPLYIGNIGIHGSFAANTAVSGCDALMSVGVRFNDRITGRIGEFAPNATLIHKAVMLEVQEWREEIKEWKRLHPLHMKPAGLTPRAVLDAISRMFESYIVVTDVGQNQLWATQFLELREGCQLLTSGGLGTMGMVFRRGWGQSSAIRTKRYWSSPVTEGCR